MLFIAARPMYFLELAFGQFVGRGILNIWSCAPIMHGIGYAMVGLGLVVSIYYSVVMSYALYYIGASFSSELPWTKCDPTWVECVVRGLNTTGLTDSATNVTAFNGTLISASQLYWDRTVLGTSSGLDELGGLKWDLVLCFALSWLIVVITLSKGVNSLGKAVYFTSTFPYLILLTMAGIGLSRPGAFTGIAYMFKPNFTKLTEAKVWHAAATQALFSLGVGDGTLITYASYNDFSHNVYRLVHTNE